MTTYPRPDLMSLLAIRPRLALLCVPSTHFSPSPHVLRMHEAEQQNADSIGVKPLGSGSDFTVFLQRIGVSCDFPRLNDFISPLAHRLQARTVALVRRCMILFITIIVYLTVKDGRNFSVIQDSTDM